MDQRFVLWDQTGTINQLTIYKKNQQHEKLEAQKMLGHKVYNILYSKIIDI